MRPVVHDKRHALPQLGGDGHVWGLCGRILVMCSKVRTQGLGNLSKRRSTGVPWTWSGFLAVDPKFTSPAEMWSGFLEKKENLWARTPEVREAAPCASGADRLRRGA